MLADGGGALPFGQDGRRSKSLPWDVPAAEQEKGVVWSESRHLSSFLSPPTLWWHHLVQEDNVLSPFCYPIFSWSIPAKAACQGSEHGGLPGSLWGSRSLLFLCAGGAQRTSLEALPLFAEGTGSPCSFFAGGCGRRGCCGSRWSLLEGLGASLPAGWGGGSPFTARLGEGSLASYMVSSQLSASMGLCCYSSN